MKLKELYNMLDGSLETIDKYLEDKKKFIYIFNINMKHQEHGKALITVDASGIGYTEEISKFIYSTLIDLDDIEWVDYHRYDSDEDLYYFGVEFK